jgi:hypothetical protein
MLVNRWQQTALMLAAINGEEAVVNRLIGFGAYLNVQDRLGNTALRYAVVNGHLRIVEILTEAGAIIHICNRDGDTDLCFAIRYKKFAYIDVLVAAMIRRGVTVLPLIVEVKDVSRFSKVNRELLWQNRASYLRLIEGCEIAHYLNHESTYREICEMIDVN